MPDSPSQRMIARKLPQIARNWQFLADEALAEFRLSSSTGRCLVELARLGPDVNQAELAAELGITQPSLVRTLHQLEAMALVERAPGSDDKRANRILLTPQGKDLTGRIEARLTELRQELLDGVPDAAIEITANLMELLGRRIVERRRR